LHPAKAQQYSLGLGYGTDTGARASLGWQWRRVTPTGHYLQTLLRVSQDRNDSLQARYIIPGKHPSTDQYALTAGIFTNTPGTGSDEYTLSQVGASYTHFRNQWLRTISLQLQHEDFNSNGDNKTSNILFPSASWEKVQTNNRINTINGYRVYFQADVGIAAKSDTNFMQAEFQGKYIRSFNQQKNRLIFTADLGVTHVKNFADMPLSHKYFAGGANSLRGYKFQVLGPGRYLVGGGVEWQRRWHGNFYGALFYNAGNAPQNLPLDLQQAVGVGVVYRSPIGPIEVTVAHPLNRPDNVNFHNYVVQFSMGPDL
jgi:translocation and assembly module TamA